VPTDSPKPVSRETTFGQEFAVRTAVFSAISRALYEIDFFVERLARSFIDPLRVKWIEFTCHRTRRRGNPPVPAFWQRIRFIVLIGCTANFASMALGDPRIIFVNQSATGSNQGTSWTDAYNDLQDALAVAQVGDEIWVAAGKYTPDRGTKDRNAFFSIPDGIELYGGFVGTETDPSQRDCLTNETVLTGDLNGDDATGPPSSSESNCFDYSEQHTGFGCDDPICETAVCAARPECCGSRPQYFPSWDWQCARQAQSSCCQFVNTCENTFDVVKVIDDLYGVVVDGVSIHGAYGPGNGQPLGTGLSVINSPIEVRNVIFRGNTYQAVGAEESLRLTFTDCSFYNNAQVGGTYNCVVTMDRCEFEKNIGGFGSNGGGLTVIDSDFKATRFPSPLIGMQDGPFVMAGCRVSQFQHDWAVLAGGFGGNNSVYITDTVFDITWDTMYLSPTNATITNCKFLNTRRQAIYAVWSTIKIRDSVFDVTGMDGRTGAIYDDESNVVLDHCTFMDNVGYEDKFGAVLTMTHGARATIRNSIIWDPRMYSYDGEIIGESAAFYSVYDDSTLVIDNSIVEGWTGTLGGVGNSGSDPDFVDPSGNDGILGTLDDDLRLSPGSPAINAGDPNFIPASGETDLDGHARILCGRTDIGAYEFGIGDYDCNQSFDVTDFVGWSNCATGPLFAPPGRPAYSPPCAAFDFDADGDVDLKDFYGLQQVFVTP